MTRALVLALLVAAGCSNGHGLVTLTVSVPAGGTLAVDHVQVQVTDQTRVPARTSSAITVAVPGSSLPPALTIPLLFDHDVDGKVLISVAAALTDGTTETATAEAQVSTYHTTTATVVLPLPSIQPPPPLPGDMATCAGANLAYSSKYVINAFTAPTSRSDFAYDLNGDGKADNQFGSLCAVLIGQGYGLQAALDAEVAGGTDLLLLELASRDSGFANDSCAASHVRNAVDQANPNFGTTGTFTPDSTPESLFDGALVAAAFDSLPAPAAATTPVQLRIKLPLSGETLIPLTGGHVSYTLGVDHLFTGQIQGAIAVSDLQNIFIPAVAQRFSALVAQSPCGSDCMTIKSIFDNGGVANSHCPQGTCANPDGTCAVANDNQISSCEISTNSLVANVLAPDVQMTDGKGNYHPAPTNAIPDSLSVGLGFTAVSAQYSP